MTSAPRGSCRAFRISWTAFGSDFTDDSQRAGWSQRSFTIRFTPLGYRAIPPHPIFEASINMVIAVSRFHGGRTRLGLAIRIFLLISVNGCNLFAYSIPTGKSHVSMSFWHSRAMSVVAVYALKSSLCSSSTLEQQRIKPMSIANCL